MLGKLLFFFLILPFLEVYVLIRVGREWGFLNTFGTVVCIGVLGLLVIRSQGRNMLLNVQAQVAKGELPARHLLEGLVIFAGGVLLVIPGFVSDVIGLTMILPGLRGLWSSFLLSQFKNTRSAGGGAWRTPGGGFVFYSSTRPRDPASSATPFERDVTPKQIIDVKPEREE
jgi:UPF0716 protein FxsA